MKLLFTSLLFLFITRSVCAQQEYYKWYFGNQAAIDFVTGTPVNVSNNAMIALDNPAVVCASLGNILFYSNGEQVWGRNHTLMPNGSGLLGALTGGHAATAVKKPGSSNLYYLFTMDGFAGANGLRYNIIDMNLNGGLGDIVSGQKNIMLVSQASEQIIPVLAANGNDIWIVTHPWNSTSFSSFLITCNGLNTTPIISTAGTIRNGNTNNALGQINVNATNDRIAWTNWGTGIWELFDFNNSTGALSNALTFTGANFPWAIEFSPNGNKLYLSGWTTQYVLQFDLSNYTQAAISASQVNLGNVTGPGAPYFTGYMQRAPDGKIYIAVFLDSFLAVINSPDATGLACNLVDDGFNLAGRTSSAGLPDKIAVTHQSSSTFTLGNDTAYCGSFSHTLTTGNAATVWSTGATGSQITVTTAGTYWASITNGCGSISDTIVIAQTGNANVNLGPNTTLCSGQSLLLDATSAGATYLWQDNSSVATFNVIGAGIYSVTVTNASGCAATGSINISYNTQLPVVNLGSDVEQCGNNAIVLNPQIANAAYVWNDNSTDTTLTVYSSGTYSVTVSTGCGSAADAINIKIYADECALLIPTAFSPNNDGANDVFRAACRCPITRYGLHIYNRWGELVFATEDITEGWNGMFRDQAQPLSVYVYYIDYFNYCEQKMKKIVGNVTLVK